MDFKLKDLKPGDTITIGISTKLRVQRADSLLIEKDLTSFLAHDEAEDGELLNRIEYFFEFLSELVQDLTEYSLAGRCFHQKDALTVPYDKKLLSNKMLVHRFGAVTYEIIST